MPLSVDTYANYLKYYQGTEPGAVCHLAVGPGQERDDLYFVVADAGGIRLAFPERDAMKNQELFEWGDIREFWTWETYWLLSEDRDISTHYRLYRSRIEARDALLKGVAEEQPKDQVNHKERVQLWEERRRSHLQIGSFHIRPVRLF